MYKKSRIMMLTCIKHLKLFFRKPHNDTICKSVRNPKPCRNENCQLTIDLMLLVVTSSCTFFYTC